MNNPTKPSFVVSTKKPNLQQAIVRHGGVLALVDCLSDEDGDNVSAAVGVLKLW